jgi:Fe2+ or Zn2+ uptake regulation protein
MSLTAQRRVLMDHFHLACFRCGRIQEFPSPMFERFKEEISRQTGFDIRVTRLELGGICRACAAKGAEISNQQHEEGATRAVVQ